VIHRQRHRLPNHLPQPPQSPQFRPSSRVRSPFPAPKYISIAQWKASSPHSRPPSTLLNPHSRCCGVGCPIPRDFVPWRFSDACCCCAWNPSSCRRQRNLHNTCLVALRQPSYRLPLTNGRALRESEHGGSVPTTDLSRCSKPPLFNHLIHTQQDRLRNGAVTTDALCPFTAAQARA